MRKGRMETVGSFGLLQRLDTSNHHHYRSRPDLVSLRSQELGDVCTLENATVYSSLLSEKGMGKAAKILWCVNHHFPQIEFAPVLLPLTCVLLCFIEEDEALTLLIKILEKSRQLLNANADRVFLTFRRTEFVR